MSSPYRDTAPNSPRKFFKHLNKTDEAFLFSGVPSSVRNQVANFLACLSHQWTRGQVRDHIKQYIDDKTPTKFVQFLLWTAFDLMCADKRVMRLLKAASDSQIELFATENEKRQQVANTRRMVDYLLASGYRDIDLAFRLDLDVVVIRDVRTGTALAWDGYVRLVKLFRQVVTNA
jgi:hypothetical protein